MGNCSGKVTLGTDDVFVTLSGKTKEEQYETMLKLEINKKNYTKSSQKIIDEHARAILLQPSNN